MDRRIPMVSIAKHRYEGRTLLANDHFEAKNERDAEDLEVLNFARRIPATPKAYERRDMQAAEQSAATLRPAAEPLSGDEDSGDEAAGPSSADTSPVLIEPSQEDSSEVAADTYSSSGARRNRYSGRRDMNAKR